MGCGYFGKLPMRGDFVRGGCPDGFLKIWEPFLNAGLAQARHDLKKAWEEAYMTMPVWKFFLEAGAGPGALATDVAGAFMPNVDRVGRTYPLTVVCELASGSGTGRLRFGSSTEWFDQVEAVLRSTLEDTARFERFQDQVSSLPCATRQAVPMDLPAIEAPGSEQARGRAVCRAAFWASARGHTHHRQFDGLPEAAEFRWFLQPELFAEDSRLTVAGKDHGQSGEDLQT